MNKLKRLLKLLLPKYQKLILDYPVNMKPRYGHKKPPHKRLHKIISANQENYKAVLNDIIAHQSIFHSIKKTNNESNDNEPTWNNGFFPGLDMVSLYAIIAKYKPKKFIEIGSGNSTKLVRKCITDNSLSTQITSIDPLPRASIDHLADIIIRKPFEEISNYSFIIDGLNKGDVLFIDNSHRCLPNSDAIAFFMDILPYLKKGVIVHIHDIYLPYDYPQFMCDRFYSEQYTLAAFLLANPNKYNPLFPSYYISKNEELAAIITDIWKSENTKGVEKHGGSFWIEIA